MSATKKRAAVKAAGRAPARPDDPSTWPIVWRVVAPTAGSFNHDMVFIETEDEEEARKSFRGLRRQSWPVRLERVSCGPLPPQATANIVLLRATNAQNPGGEPRNLLAAWEAPR
jgi:hypothetical protein